SASFDALVPPPPPPAATPEPSIATPSDPTAKPVNTSVVPAPALNIPTPPARANAEFSRALTLMRGGDPTQAILEMQVLTQSYPDLPGPYANLGVLHRNANQLPESEAALAKATERAAWDAQTWTEYGLTLRQAGKFTEARTAYETAIKVNPSYAPAHRNLGVLLDLFLDDPLTAQTELETYKQLTGEDKPVSGWLAELRSRNKVRAPAPEAAPAPETNPEPAPKPEGGA
ncbi:MAG TPA: tetratricopeptide repeat protein, partial [Steroidobacteraceae bacterium]|nr:tetratricopeptide repeat protein [Steroidobacteraceae bacterium]